MKIVNYTTVSYLIHSSYYNTGSGEQNLSENFSFQCIAKAENAAMDVIFIHGLTGDALDTWTNEDKDFWPNWLISDFPDVSVYTMGYPASMFEKWAKKEMDIFERAASTLDYMTSNGIGEKPIAFITHSLGGILAKVILRKSCDTEEDDWKAVAKNTKLVVFLGTPHTGSSLASAFKVFVPHFASKHVDLLTNKTGILSDIGEHYKTFANKNITLKTASYYEKYKTKKIAIVVPRDSSNPGVQGCTPVATDKDHTNICKPNDKHDPIYAGIHRHVKNALKKVSPEEPQENEGFDHDNYGDKAEHDRRDLLEKLIAANLEHEYELANNYQNRFAQNYMKLGLYTSAKEENDKLLAETEQRFITHIYHPLICNGASDQEIKKALQENVIDAICLKRKNQKGFSEATVLRALYFLTEQCHIRWDAAQ